MKQKPIGVVINPTSGKGRGAAVTEKVWRALAGVDTIDLSAATYAEAQANAKTAVAEDTISALFVVGGDGMMHLGVNACAMSDIPLGLIAAGTGNDAATVLGLPIQDVPRAVSLALDYAAKPRPVDLIAGEARNEGPGRERRFFSFGSVSAGFDALVNARANAMKWPKGPSRYQLAMVLELLKFHGIKYEATIDGKKRHIDAMLCAVANIHSFGGGMKIAPEAKFDDGKLDLFIVNRIPRSTLLRIFPKVYSGGHVTHPSVEFVRANSVKLDSGDLPVYSDGEFVGMSPVSTYVIPHALWVCAP